MCHSSAKFLIYKNIDFLVWAPSPASSLMVFSWGRGRIKKNVLGSTHVVEQLSFSMLPSFLTYDFDLIFRSFLTSWGPSGIFYGLANTVLGSEA